MYSLFRRTGSDLTGSAMRHRGKHLRHIALAVAVIVMGGAAAATRSEAAAVHTVSLFNNVFLFDQAESSPNPLTATFSATGNNTSATGTGFSGNGTLTNDISHNRNSRFGASGGVTLSVISAYDDIVFFDIANPSSTASAMVAVSADFTASNPQQFGSFTASLQVLFNLAGVASSSPLMSLDSGPISGTFSSSFVSVPLNTLVAFSIIGRLRSGTTFQFASGGTTISTSEVTFPTFILPQGIGVTSASLFPPSSVIPLPAALPLFLTGLAGLGLMRRRKRQALRD